MIRTIRKEDKQVYCKLADKFYHTEGVMHAVPCEFLESAFDMFLTDKTYGDIFVYEENKEIVGYALIAKSYSQEAGGLVVWIEELFVEKEHEGKGIGTALFKYVLNNFSVARFRLEVEPENERAVSLYKKFGFKFIEYQQMIKELKFKG